MINDIELKKLLGRRIKEIRCKKGFTQEKLSEMIGIGERNLSKIECGNNFLTAETLTKLVNVLEINVYDLFNFEQNKDIQLQKAELLKAIEEETVNITLLYRFYLAIK